MSLDGANGFSSIRTFLDDLDIFKGFKAQTQALQRQWFVIDDNRSNHHAVSL
jgi:hypothetical protein